jgi:dTDP-4-amino-4,6-dideoxygalactose transaminase
MGNIMKIPFNRPSIVGQEAHYVSKALVNGHMSGDGPYTRMCSQLLEQELGVPKVLLTTSCTHALEMAALLLELCPGDEVILPSFTFVSTANAFVLRGARPVFVDIRKDTLGIDESLISQAITPKTKAIVVVHYAGVGCEMDVIQSLANTRGLSVIEDNAHGLFGSYKGKLLGTFGSLATLSFHETKNFSCGEGGALIINDHQFVQRAEILREKGTNRSAFFRGQVDKYTWKDLGSSYLPSDVLAAFLYGQLEMKNNILRRRRAIWNRYAEGLGDWAKANNVILPQIPAACVHPAHLFYLILPSLTARQALIAHLKAKGILSVFHYLPLHLSPMGRHWGYKDEDLPTTEQVSDCLLRLPLFYSLSGEDVEVIIKTIIDWHFRAHT